MIAEDLSDEQVKAYRLADNKTNEFSDWNWSFVDSELEDIADIDMEQFGFELEPSSWEVDGGDPDDNQNEPVGIKIKFKDTALFKKYEVQIREFVDSIGDANVSVDGYASE